MKLSGESALYGSRGPMQSWQNYSVLRGDDQPLTREELTCLIPGAADFSVFAEVANGRDAVAPPDGAGPGPQVDVPTRVFRRFAEDSKRRNNSIEPRYLLTRWQSLVLLETEVLHHTMAGLLSMLLNIALLAAACLTLALQPTLLQTWWFRAVLLTCAGLATLAIYRLRVHQLTRLLNVRFEERLAERRRIAQELHDTLLQSFQGLMLRFQVANQILLSNPSEAKEALEGALNRADQALRESRKAIQGIRSDSFSDRDIERALGVLMNELAADTYLTKGKRRTTSVIVEGQPKTVNPWACEE